MRIIIDFVVDETGGAVTVSSGEGTASTSGAVVIRSVNGGQAGSSGVLMYLDLFHTA